MPGCLTSGGLKTTIPREVAEDLDIKVEDYLQWEILKGSVRVKRVRLVEQG